MFGGQCDSYVKMNMPDSQQYPWSLNLSKMWKIPSFLGLKRCLFLRVSPVLLKSKKCASHLSRKTENEISSFTKQKHGYLIYPGLDKGF